MEKMKSKQVHLDAGSLSADVKAVLLRFVQTTRANGYSDVHIEQVIRNTISTDYDHLRQILELRLMTSTKNTT